MASGARQLSTSAAFVIGLNDEQCARILPVVPLGCVIGCPLILAVGGGFFFEIAIEKKFVIGRVDCLPITERSVRTRGVCLEAIGHP